MCYKFFISYLKLSGFNLVTIYSSSIKIGANPSKSTCKNIDRKIAIYCFIFIILNNSLFIDLLTNNLSFVIGKDNIYTNLLLRTIIFGVAIFYINKINL